ncbi:MAG: VWA domain-containing protein [Subdoligranulum sp.]|nr:VWA domain-containing protein [Subdoligranulum sp.]
MAITNTDKTLSETRISRDGTLEVTLSVTAQPGGTACGDMDVALVLDRSGSMAGSPLEHLKTGAKDFIDLVLARGGAKDDGSDGSRVGIVSFAGTATTDVPLTSDSAALRRAVDALTAQGSTNHADGFTAGGALLNGSTRKKVLVIFTDGETTVGADPTAIAEKLRRHGVEIYCVGLVGRTGLD